jgi:transcriptional antiterminator RfaH
LIQPSVKRLVRHGNHPAAVSISILETLKRREDANGFIQLDHRPKFSRGDKVCVLDGAFHDCFGLYEGMNGGDRVAILLDLLGRKVRVVLNSELIEAA